ncbi:hypothetical protein [Clostridium botulinum]|uniref:hypothetical protein n=1 Tax=Clostridium botulinum TaxID=1491 RepID=UPI00067D2B05|nr:hypothetical protein [Clostridium botulinum]
MENRKPPKTYTYRTKKEEHPYVVDWLEGQSNLNDAIRFLIEEDIKKNGVRDLSKYIPAIRSLPNAPSPNVINNKLYNENINDIIDNKLGNENINNIIKKMDNVKKHEEEQIQQEEKEIEVQKVKEKEIEKEVNNDDNNDNNFDDIPSCYQ